ncbi:gliding motility-associated C-terminal domain-containing protein [Hymenobacter sp. M29]|uniref:Gliding motility-associated C-terminal domain-containing protein n=1 Tax=Hymenobacter mellowenesis TaxID=3063995 RepID=A0ABT9AIJ0_9BACT|nr:gliding motility-associated C-terminal domain-containing protein [Hymenobacter sp. M29]MDO7849675.1 gliding motility-associated C-terminal domain-containing protein [Hymenobacter sp. M29]
MRLFLPSLGPACRAALLLTAWLVLGLNSASASHLVGGELTYKFLDGNGPSDRPYRYEITAQIYFSKEASSYAPDGTSNIIVTFYNKPPRPVLVATLDIPRSSFAEITAPTPPGCFQQEPRVTLARYVGIVELPVVANGYMAVFSASSRSPGIVNLLAPQSETMTLTVDMTPGTMRNSSPTFTDRAVVATCLGDNSFVLNNAYDADGDRLQYQFAQPMGAVATNSLGAPYIRYVDYARGYYWNAPFGTGGINTIDAITGLARYYSPTQGTFLLAIDVQEYRRINGQEVLLGTTRRDILLVVRACAGGVNTAPAFTPASVAQTYYQVQEGQSLGFDVTAFDTPGQPLTMNVSSALLDGPGGIDATLNGQVGAVAVGLPAGRVAVAGAGTLTGAFRLRAGCGLARATPYDVVVTVTDQACNSQSVVAVFRILVTRPGLAVSLSGESVLCAGATGTYRVVGPALAVYNWTVYGGRLVGPTNGATVQVKWTAGVPSRLTLRGTTPAGCFTDSVSYAVNVRPGPVVTGPLVYCRQRNTNLPYRIEGPQLAYQWSIANGTIVSGQGTNEVQVDISEGLTATLEVAGPGTCTRELRVGPDNTCLAFFNVITPNGDRQNDWFVIENVERHPKTALTIFNRWGRQIYQSADYQNTFGGENAGPGLHYYFCQLADGTVYKGWFEIIR